MTDPEKPKDGEIGFISYEYKGVPIHPVPKWYINMLEGQMKTESQPGDIVKQLDALANEINSQPKEDYCGIVPLTTGKWDPYYKAFVCQAHDKNFQAMKDNLPNDGIAKTTGNFVVGALGVAAQGLYSVVTLPLYLLIGGIGGVLRWGQLRQEQITKDAGSPGDDDVLGDDT